MTRRIKRDAKSYANENVIHTVKILEALAGANFEPVSIPQIIERVGIIPDKNETLKPDKVRRVLVTLELLGWAQPSSGAAKEWTAGAKVLRFANRYGELCIAALNR